MLSLSVEFSHHHEIGHGYHNRLSLAVCYCIESLCQLGSSVLGHILYASDAFWMPMENIICGLFSQRDTYWTSSAGPTTEGGPYGIGKNSYGKSSVLCHCE